MCHVRIKKGLVIYVSSVFRKSPPIYLILYKQINFLNHFRFKSQTALENTFARINANNFQLVS